MRFNRLIPKCLPLPHIFKASQDGSVALIFAFSFLAIGGIVGAALDYSRFLTVKKLLQAAADQAVSSAAVVDRNTSTPQAAGAAAFDANWNSKQRSTTSNIVITEPNTNEVAAKATANLPTTFLSILGITSVPIEVNATVAFGHNKAEVALALDVTGSMSGTKITDLKTAAKLLIDTAYTPAGSDQKVKFSLVPFSSYVNVGLTYRNAPWMSVPTDSSSTTNVCSTVTPVATKSNCTTKTATAYNDGVPYTYTYEDCTYTYGPPETQCSDVTTTTTWAGCAGARVPKKRPENR